MERMSVRGAVRPVTSRTRFTLVGWSQLPLTLDKELYQQLAEKAGDVGILPYIRQLIVADVLGKAPAKPFSTAGKAVSR